MVVRLLQDEAVKIKNEQLRYKQMSKKGKSRCIKCSFFNTEKKLGITFYINLSMASSILEYGLTQGLSANLEFSPKTSTAPNFEQLKHDVCNTNSIRCRKLN